MIISKTALCVGILCLCTLAIAQIQDPGPVTHADFEVEAQGESAIYLINDAHTEVYFDRSLEIWKVSTEVVLRIKILKVDAFDLGNIVIPLIVRGKLANKQERIDNLRAVTYNINDETGLIEARPFSNEKGVMVKKEKSKEEFTFAMPDVRLNSIIELRYEKVSPFVGKIEGWEFQKEFPVKRSRYSFTTTIYHHYISSLRGYIEPQEVNTKFLDDSQVLYGNGNYWLFENVPAFRKQPQMTGGKEHLSRLKIQLQAVITPNKKQTYFKTWEEVTNDLKIDNTFKVYYESKKKFNVFTLSAHSDASQRAREVYDQFKTTFRWNHQFGVLPDVSYNEIIKSREGNTSAMGLLLFRLMRQAGLDPKLVMFSPRHKGKLDESYPFADNLIAMVVKLNLNGVTHLLDPVNDVPFSYLDKQFLNGKGLILGDSITWQDLTINAFEEKTGRVDLSLSAASLKAELAYTMNGYASLFDPAKSEIFTNSDWEIEMEGAETGTLKNGIKAKIEQSLEGDQLFIPLVFDELIFGKNPFENTERLYPVDFYFKKNYEYNYSIDLSEEYEFKFIPESELIQMEDGQLYAKVNVKALGQRLEIDFQFQATKTNFPVEQYPIVRSAYELMENLKKLEIVVQRKTQ